MTKQIIELEVKPGRSIYVEVDDDTGGSRQLSSGGTRTAIKQAFADVSSTLSAVADDIQEKFGALKDAGPKKIVVELNAQVKSQGKLFIVSGEVQGGIKVQLTWER